MSQLFERNIELPVHNSTSSNLSSSDLDENTIKLINKVYADDIELYEDVKNKTLNTFICTLK